MNPQFIFDGILLNRNQMVNKDFEMGSLRLPLKIKEQFNLELAPFLLTRLEIRENFRAGRHYSQNEGGVPNFSIVAFLLKWRINAPSRKRAPHNSQLAIGCELFIKRFIFQPLKVTENDLHPVIESMFRRKIACLPARFVSMPQITPRLLFFQRF